MKIPVRTGGPPGTTGRAARPDPARARARRAGTGSAAARPRPRRGPRRAVARVGSAGCGVAPSCSSKRSDRSELRPRGRIRGGLALLADRHRGRAEQQHAPPRRRSRTGDEPCRAQHRPGWRVRFIAIPPRSARSRARDAARARCGPRVGAHHAHLLHPRELAVALEADQEVVERDARAGDAQVDRQLAIEGARDDLVRGHGFDARPAGSRESSRSAAGSRPG